MTRNEHLAWCKQRANDLVNKGRYLEAINSMISDLGKHPETASSIGIGAMLMLTVRDVPSARRYIDGFN